MKAIAFERYIVSATLEAMSRITDAAVSLPVAVGPRSRLSPVRRWAWAASGLIAQLPWLVPALVVGSAAAPQAGAAVKGLFVMLV